MTEKDIQLALYRHLLGEHRKCIIPNIWTGVGEADLIALTQSNYLHEFEIKISRADFRNDFKHKRVKHDILSGSDRYKGGYRRLIPTAYFYYAVPENLISVEEVPEYAGLIYVSEKHHCLIIKSAPKISNEKVTLEQENRIMRGCCYRMWNMMIKENRRAVRDGN
jgi:hypothetical protein